MCAIRISQAKTSLPSRKGQQLMKYLPTPTKYLSALLHLVVLLALCQVARAVDVPYTGPTDGNWNEDANWSFAPPDVAFNEVGQVINGATVVLNEHTKSAPSGNPPFVDVDVAGLRLGTGTGATATSIGGLRIVSGGVMNAVPHTGTFTPPETGALAIGGTGQGNLTILGNGILTGTSLTLAGPAASSITLSNTATLTVSGTANLQRTTTINGPSVNFSANGNLSLSGTSILVPNITNSSNHSKIVTQGTASVNGTLKPMFTGVTPAAGNKWTLIDAPTTINGTFATVDTSMAPALPAGSSYSVFQETIGGRRLLQLAIEEILILQVNRTTGAVSIANIGTQPKTLDGYSILSAHGSLTGAWNSLDDQNIGGAGAWVEANPEANNLSELFPGMGGTTVNPGSPSNLNLGTPYQVTVPALGVDPDDLTFEYNSPTRGTVRGVVQYSGTKTANNFVLTVNQADGRAQLKLDSPLETAIDGYAIHSPAGTLLPGSWNSLQDQGATGWEQAPPSPSTQAVAELKADGSLEFQNNTGFQLGQLFAAGGTPDPNLRLEYLLPGESTPRLGTIVFGPITNVLPPSVGLPGDYNGDGRVDAADYVVWRKTDGTQNGYNLWRTNFGRTAGSGSSIGGSTAVPEPSTVALLVLTLVAVVGLRGARR
jgi:hypothetical protein